MRVDTFSGRLLFGSHKNRPLSSPDVPTAYLRWVVREVELSETERRAVERELQRRGDSGGNGYKPVTPPRLSNVPPADLLRIIAAGRQTLAKRLHPDAGGSNEAMTAVNRAADYLEHVAQQITLASGGAA